MAMASGTFHRVGVARHLLCGEGYCRTSSGATLRVGVSGCKDELVLYLLPCTATECSCRVFVYASPIKRADRVSCKGSFRFEFVQCFEQLVVYLGVWGDVEI